VVEQLFRKQMPSTKTAQSVRETAAFLCVVSKGAEVARRSLGW
jgi:hypothetical protein